MSDQTEKKIEQELLKHLLTPSYLSASIAVGVTLLVVASTLLSKLYWSSGWLASTLQTIKDSNQHLLQFDTGAGDSPLNVVMLFLFWACIGLAVYFVIIGIIRAVGQARELEQEMTYVHTNRRAIVTTFLERTGVRGIGLVLFFVSVAILVKVALPYAIAAVAAATAAPVDMLLMVVGVCVLLLMLHVVTVVMRVVVLRPRLFSEEIYS